MASTDINDEIDVFPTFTSSVIVTPCDGDIVEDMKNEIQTPITRSVSTPPPQQDDVPELVQRSVSEGTASTACKKVASETTNTFNSSKAGKNKIMSRFVTWWKEKARENRQKRDKEKTEEIKMRYKLQYHFMSPFQKYKRGRKPWKLFLQIVKIIVVTTQVILFGSERFASVFFINHTHLALRYLFIKGFTDPPPGPEPTPISFNYYNREDLANAIIFANEMYVNLLNESIGIYWFDKKDKPVTPMLFCVERYVTHGNNSGVIEYSSPIVKNCTNGVPYDVEGLLQQFHKKRYFDSLKAIFLQFQLTTLFINSMRMLHRPECYQLKNTIYIDNAKHDGKLAVSLDMLHTLMPKCPNEFKETKDAATMRGFYIAFDILVVTLCVISLSLCVRSVIKSVMLASVARVYFKEYKNEILSRGALFELINKWFIVIVLSDILSIIGSLYKIRVDYRDIHYYNICSVFLGIGVLLVWVGILRFFTYLPNYNILLIALRVAAPNLMRFMFCALFIFFGFTFCGWIVLGPYHEKFDTFSKTCDCLYSLLNGDDMYVTFNIMSKASTPVWIFSKIYLYVFISLFIYVVLSTFISIVSDSYERIKFSGRMPPTKIESFMDGGSEDDQSQNRSVFCDGRSRDSDPVQPSISTLNVSVEKVEDLSSSRLSVMSASLD